MLSVVSAIDAAFESAKRCPHSTTFDTAVCPAQLYSICTTQHSAIVPAQYSTDVKPDITAFDTTVLCTLRSAIWSAQLSAECAADRLPLGATESPTKQPPFGSTVI